MMNLVTCPRCGKSVERVRDWIGDHTILRGEALCQGSGEDVPIIADKEEQQLHDD